MKRRKFLNIAMYSLCVEGVGKQYHQTLLFEDITFSMKPGDVVGITGWNGSGKSTLVRIIAGLVRPSAGCVRMMSGEKVLNEAAKRRFIGLVAPAFSLYDELTGIENLEFFYKIRGVAFDRVDTLDRMAQMGLEGLTDRLCRDYSSGMKQRLKIIQALIHHPPLLLLDEPGTNLDRKGMQMVEDIVTMQRQTGMTIIASNEKQEVDYANRIINLSD